MPATATTVDFDAFTALPPAAWRMLCDQAPVPMLIVRGQRIRYANLALAELSGYTVGELLSGMAPSDLVTLPVNETRIAVCAHGKPLECRRKDGGVFPARVWVRRAELGGRRAEFVTVQDLSKTAEARQVATRRADLLAQTEELALSGSCDHDLASGLVTRSAGMFRIFGEPVTDGPVSGEWLMRRVPASEAGFVQAILEGVRPGLPCEFEHRIRRADGSVRTVLHRSMAEADPCGQATRVISILQDITAQRAAEQ